jgi:hypothetical protein
MEAINDAVLIYFVIIFRVRGNRDLTLALSLFPTANFGRRGILQGPRIQVTHGWRCWRS